MTGTLTLDGQNDPSSVFIFRTTTTLIKGYLYPRRPLSAIGVFGQEQLPQEDELS